MDVKKCSKCEEVKSVDAFCKKSASKDGLQAWCKVCNTLQKGMWIKENKQKVADTRLWTRHRLRPDELAGMLVAQKFLCKICLTGISRETLHIDHNHKCCPEGKSCETCRRGLLCNSCNIMVGSFEKARDAGLREDIDNYISGVLAQ